MPLSAAGRRRLSRAYYTGTLTHDTTHPSPSLQHPRSRQAPSDKKCDISWTCKSGETSLWCSDTPRSHSTRLSSHLATRDIIRYRRVHAWFESSSVTLHYMTLPGHSPGRKPNRVQDLNKACSNRSWQVHRISSRLSTWHERQEVNEIHESLPSAWPPLGLS